MKKNYLKKRVMSLLLALVMMLCVTLSAGATEAPSSTPEGEIELGENDFIVPEAAAAYIAEFFVEDMAGSGNTKWNSETKAVNTVVMYDETGLAPSAYAVELTEGYVVVSAYADVPSLILEWADDGEPVYSEAPLEADEDIIYTSPLDYYVTDGETVETFQGEEVDAEEIPTPLQDCRSEENVNPDLWENIAEEKAAWLEEHPLAAYAGTNEQKGDYITDVFKYAHNAYRQRGEWKCTDWKNYWENYVSNVLIDTNVLPAYQNPCGVVSITNMIRLYGNKFNDANSKTIRATSSLNLFKTVANVGNYYNNSSDPYTGGVYPDKGGVYAKEAFKKFNIGIAVGNFTLVTESTVKTALNASNKLMMICLYASANQPYGQHFVVGYAYNVLWNDYYNEYCMFIKILDGKNVGARFVDATLLAFDGPSEFYSISF